MREHIGATFASAITLVKTVLRSTGGRSGAARSACRAARHHHPRHVAQ